MVYHICRIVMTIWKSSFQRGGSAQFLGGTGGKIVLKGKKTQFSLGLKGEFFNLSLKH